MWLLRKRDFFILLVDQNQIPNDQLRTCRIFRLQHQVGICNRPSYDHIPMYLPDRMNILCSFWHWWHPRKTSFHIVHSDLRWCQRDTSDRCHSRYHRIPDLSLQCSHYIRKVCNNRLWLRVARNNLDRTFHIWNLHSGVCTCIVLHRLLRLLRGMHRRKGQSWGKVNSLKFCINKDMYGVTKQVLDGNIKFAKLEFWNCHKICQI